MIAEARSALPDCQFVEADIRNWQPEQALDLIFANASLQWLPDHYELFPHLVSLLNPQGVLAVQMPDNWLEPTHVLMREVAREQNYPDRGREPLAGVHAYYDILSEAGCEVDIWRTTYYHQMPSHRGDYRLGDRHWITSVVTGSDRANSSFFLRATIRCWKSSIHCKRTDRYCWHFRVFLLLPAVRSNYHVSW